LFSGNTTVVGTAGTDLETISFVILVLEILGFLSQAGGPYIAALLDYAAVRSGRRGQTRISSPSIFVEQQEIGPKGTISQCIGT
jgi:hypothetical protein